MTEKKFKQSYDKDDIELKFMMLRHEFERGLTATNHYRVSEMLLIMVTAAADFGKEKHRALANQRIRAWLNACYRVEEQQMDPIFYSSVEIENVDAVLELYRTIQPRIKSKEKFQKTVEYVLKIYGDVVVEDLN